jgi:hypothetical protein
MPRNAPSPGDPSPELIAQAERMRREIYECRRRAEEAVAESRICLEHASEAIRRAGVAAERRRPRW